MRSWVLLNAGLFRANSKILQSTNIGHAWLQRSLILQTLGTHFEPVQRSWLRPTLGNHVMQVWKSYTTQHSVFSLSQFRNLTVYQHFALIVFELSDSRGLMFYQHWDPIKRFEFLLCLSAHIEPIQRSKFLTTLGSHVNVEIFNSKISGSINTSNFKLCQTTYLVLYQHGFHIELIQRSEFLGKGCSC